MPFASDLSFLGSAIVSASLLLALFLKGQVEPLVPLTVRTREPLSIERRAMEPGDRGLHAALQMMDLGPRAHRGAG